MIFLRADCLEFIDASVRIVYQSINTNNQWIKTLQQSYTYTTFFFIYMERHKEIITITKTQHATVTTGYKTKQSCRQTCETMEFPTWGSGNVSSVHIFESRLDIGQVLEKSTSKIGLQRITASCAQNTLMMMMITMWKFFHKKIIQNHSSSHVISSSCLGNAPKWSPINL